MKTVITSLIVLLFCINLNTVSAQNKVTGIVKDRADGSPVPYATAALMRGDSSVITGVMVEEDGRFVLENVATGDYLLQVSFIGYEKTYRRLNVPKEQDLGEIFVSESSNLLEEIVVTGRRALVEQRLDRIVVNVSGNIITSGLNMNELLKQLPGLIFDGNGNAKLNGREAVIYIDNRPTNLPGDQVAKMLSGMMGDMVDRVELIDNPSARYEAGMSAAIVNIRLRRDASLGLNGTAQAGAGFTEDDFASLGGLNLNFRTKKLNIFANYGYNEEPMRSDLSQIRNYGGTTPLTYDENSHFKQKLPIHTLRAGIDWFVAPNQTIGALFNGTFYNLDTEEVAKTAVSRRGVAKTDSTILSDSRRTAKSRSQMYNLNYRLDGDKDGVLTVDLDYGRVYNEQSQNIHSRYQDADGGVLRPSTEFRNGGPRDIDILSLKLDYAKSLSDNSNLETGLKAGQTKTDNEVLHENLHENKWEMDPNQSDHFKYREQISAAYATYNHSFGKFSAMAGLRVEYTSVKGESPTMDTTFTRSYLDWFPSAHLQYQISEKQVLNLSYSRKITRPGYSLLNPFRYYSSPFTYSSGNPDLSPSYRNTLALRYNLGGYSANLSYSAQSGIFEQDYIQDDENRMMGLVQRNTGKNQKLTLGLNIPVQIAKWYGMNLYAEPSYTMMDTRYSGEKFQKNFFSFFANLNHNLTFSPSFRANMQMTWIKPTYFGLVRLDDIWGVDTQIEKSFMDNSLSLSLACKDIFSTIGQGNGTMKIGNIDQIVKQDMRQRRITLTVRYNFGSQKIRGARSRSVGIEEEMNRAR